MKYKVGDKVKINSTLGYFSDCRNKVGIIVFVTKGGEKWPYSIEFVFNNGRTYTFCGCEKELVPAIPIGEQLLFSFMSD